MTLQVDQSNWRKVTFGSVIDSITNRVDNPSESGVKRYVGLEHLDPGSMTISRWGTPDQVEATKLLFKNGDVIFGRRRAYQKKVSMADFDGICSAHALVLRGKPGVTDPLFLPVFLSSNTFLDRAIKISVGSLSPTVNWKTLSTQEFLFPPIEEQAKIATLFWKVENHKRSLERQLDNLRLVKKSWISALLESNDEWRHLKDISHITMGQSPEGKSVNQNSLGIPFFQGNADFGIDSPSIKFFTTSPKKLAKQGDILISVRAPIGDINTASVDCSIGRGLASIRPESHSDFLYIKNMMLATVESLKDKGAGSTFAAIRGDDLKLHSIPWPDEEIRNEISQILGQFEACISNCRREIDDYLDLNRVLSRDFFEGQR
jgi:type I restriction enzyme S subunit